MISINTSDYIKYYEVEINGELMKMRQLNSAESLEFAAIKDEYMGLKTSGKGNAEKLSAGFERIMDIFFGLWEDEKRARELLGKLDAETLFKLYADIVKGE